MVTLQQAQEIVRANRAGKYEPDEEFFVGDYGYENAEMFLLISGNRAEVFGARTPSEFGTIRLGGPTVVVMKATGEYRELYTLQGELPAADMVPFGERPERYRRDPS